MYIVIMKWAGKNQVKEVDSFFGYLMTQPSTVPTAKSFDVVYCSKIEED